MHPVSQITVSSQLVSQWTIQVGQRTQKLRSQGHEWYWLVWFLDAAGKEWKWGCVSTCLLSGYTTHSCTTEWSVSLRGSKNEGPHRQVKRTRDCSTKELHAEETKSQSFSKFYSWQHVSCLKMLASHVNLCILNDTQVCNYIWTNVSEGQVSTLTAGCVGIAALVS